MKPENPDQRSAIVARLRSGESVSVLAREAGVTPSTVYRWGRAAGVRRDPSRTEAATAGAAASWAARRATLANDLGEAAAKALNVCIASLDGDAPRNAQAAATTLGILVDKAQLLTGGPTNRNAPVDPVAAVAAGRARVAYLRGATGPAA